MWSEAAARTCKKSRLMTMAKSSSLPTACTPLCSPGTSGAPANSASHARVTELAVGDSGVAGRGARGASAAGRGGGGEPKESLAAARGWATCEKRWRAHQMHRVSAKYTKKIASPQMTNAHSQF